MKNKDSKCSEGKKGRKGSVEEVNNLKRWCVDGLVVR